MGKVDTLLAVFANEKFLEKRINKINGLLTTLTLRFDAFLNDFREFRQRVAPVLAEHHKKRIIELLSKEQKPRSLRWIQHRIGVYTYHLLLELEEAKLIKHSKSGFHNMYEMV